MPSPLLNTADTPIVQQAQSGVSAITAGGDLFGWVSGDIANLAASGNATVIFDLGPLWRKYSQVAVSFYLAGPSSGLSGVTISSGPNPTWDLTARRLMALGTSGGSIIYASMVTSSVWFMHMVKPTGRYLIINAPNADASNAMGATSNINITAYPN